MGVIPLSFGIKGQDCVVYVSRTHGQRDSKIQSETKGL